MELIICNTKEEASEKAKEIFVALIKEKPDCVLGLATGETPSVLYSMLIKDYEKNNTSYENVRTYNLDEYVGLESTHTQSYRYFMNKNLFEHINIKKENTYVPSGIGDCEKNAEEYDKLIDSIGNADIQLLGIGNNGHIAFNEPGSSFSATTHVVDLTEDTIKANSRFFDNIEDVPKKAVTMGIASILKAKNIILLAFGKGKAEAIKKLFEDEPTEDLPASALKNHKNVIVIVDKEAASLLNK